MSEQFYIRFAGRVEGPYDLARLQRMRVQGRLSTIHEISTDRQAWRRADTLEDVLSNGGANRQKTVSEADRAQDSAAVHSESSDSAPIWHYVAEGEQLGPFTEKQIGDWLTAGYLKSGTLLWREGLAGWIPACEIPVFQPGVTIRRPMINDGGRQASLKVETAPTFSSISSRQTLQRLRRIPMKWMIVASTIVLLLLMGCWWQGVFYGKGGSSDSRLVSGPNDMEGLAESVGLVTLAVATERDGRTLELPICSGSGFLVSPHGDVLTNRHVVEFEAKVREKLGNSWRPVIWVYFGHDRPFRATIIHQSSKHDLAILKTEARNQKFMALAKERPKSLGDSVFAVGFPGLNRNALNYEEATRQLLAKEQMQREMGFEDLRQYFLGKDFVFSMNRGTISRIVVGQAAQEVWIEHTANTNPGCSGGPLIDQNGRVLGINTMGLRSSEALSSVFLSFTMDSVESEIRTHTTGTVWK